MRKAQTSRPRQLRKVYRGLLTTSVIHRIEALKIALQWYDQSIEYLKSRKHLTDVGSIFLEDEMLRLRRQGISAKTQEEKEERFKSAIGAAEGLCKRMRPYPVFKAYAELERYMVRIESRQSNLEVKYAAVISTINNALRAPLKIRIVDSKRSRAISLTSQEIVYNRAAAKGRYETLRKKGLLAFALNEIKTLSRALSMEDDGEGHFKVNAEKQVGTIFQMLDNLSQYCRSADAPKRLVKGV